MNRSARPDRLTGADRARMRAAADRQARQMASMKTARTAAGMLAVILTAAALWGAL